MFKVNNRKLFLALFSLSTIFISVCGASSQAPLWGVQCPTTPKPLTGWPLVLVANGSCFRAVAADGLAAEAAAKILSSNQVCVKAVALPAIHTAIGMNAAIRERIVPIVVDNAATGLIDPQRIGAVGFSAGGAILGAFGVMWGVGIDPETGVDYAFRVAALVNLYGPLRLDRSSATDQAGNPTGGGGLLYVQEARKLHSFVDVPNALQWDSPLCSCGRLGTPLCACETSANLYLSQYADPLKCSFALDDANLVAMSSTEWIRTHALSHIAAQYLCSGVRDSNVVHEMSINQVVSWWSPAYRKIQVVDSGHGFSLATCTSAALASGEERPIYWLIRMLNTSGAFAPGAP